LVTYMQRLGAMTHVLLLKLHDYESTRRASMPRPWSRNAGSVARMCPAHPLFWALNVSKLNFNPCHNLDHSSSR
ncbi:hypothetical protein HAX54_023913, partial [Datura stramonium]|nr:hypothetical protein [Datura stramonium]